MNQNDNESSRAKNVSSAEKSIDEDEERQLVQEPRGERYSFAHTRPLKASVFAYTRSKKVKRDVQVFTFETVFQPFLVYF